MNIKIPQKPTKYSTIKMLAFFWGVCIFFPQPAIPVGSYNAIQTGHIIMLMTFLFCLPIFVSNRGLIAIALIFIPFCISLFALMSSTALAHHSLEVLTVAIELSPLLFTYMLWRQKEMIIKGITLGVLAQLVLVIYQLLYFSMGDYPHWMVALQNNPNYGFSSGPSQQVIMNWRAPGLFPESSALMACLTSWILLFSASSLNLFQFDSNIKSKDRIIHTIICILGTLIALVTLSGHTLVFGISLAILLFLSLWNRKSNISHKIILAPIIIALSGIIICGSIYAINVRISRDQAVQSQSWKKRSDSITGGINAWFDSDTPSFITGLLGRTGYHNGVAIETKFITSIVIKWGVRTGLLGFIGWAILLLWILRSVIHSRHRSVGLLFFLNWLVGVTIDTGYSNMMSLWCAIPFMLEWRHLFYSKKSNLPVYSSTNKSKYTLLLNK